MYLGRWSLGKKHHKPNQTKNKLENYILRELSENSIEKSTFQKIGQIYMM